MVLTMVLTMLDFPHFTDSKNTCYSRLQQSINCIFFTPTPNKSKPMNPSYPEIQVVMVDALQFEQVAGVDASSLKASGSGRFAGRLLVELDGGEVIELTGEHSRSDYMAKYGFALMSFEEMADHEVRSFEAMYQELKSEVDADTLRRLSILRSV
jgi:hypothetical protein